MGCITHGASVPQVISRQNQNTLHPRKSAERLCPGNDRQMGSVGHLATPRRSAWHTEAIGHQGRMGGKVMIALEKSLRTRPCPRVRLGARRPREKSWPGTPKGMRRPPPIAGCLQSHEVYTPSRAPAHTPNRALSPPKFGTSAKSFSNAADHGTPSVIKADRPMWPGASRMRWTGWTGSGHPWVEWRIREGAGC